MSVSLLSFSFDKAVVGAILKEWIIEAGFSFAQVARMVGMTDDMLSNVLCGRNKEVSLDRVIKICVVTSHTIDELILRSTDGIDTDFSMPVSAYVTDSPHHAETSANISGKTVNMEAGMMPAEFNQYVSHMDAHNEKMLDRFKAVHAEARKNMDDQYRASISRYENQINIINNEHKKATDEIKAAHEKTVSLLTAQTKRLRCTSWILFGILMLEPVGIIGLFLFDSLNPDVGWFRATLSRLINQTPTDHHLYL